MARNTEQLTAPVAPLALAIPNQNSVVTGVNAQAVAAPNVALVTQLMWKSRCQATAKKLTADKKKAAEAVTAAEETYSKAVQAIEVPEDFSAELIAIVAPVRAFYPDAQATTVAGTPLVKETKRRRKPAATPTPAPTTPPADEEDEDEVKHTVNVVNTTQYRVEGQIRSGGRTLLGVSRVYTLPQAVLDANVALQAAKTEVARIDRELVQVRDEMARSAEIGELAAAGTAVNQMLQTEEGRQMLEAADQLVGSIGDEAGLLPSARSIRDLAGPAALPAKKVETAPTE